MVVTPAGDPCIIAVPYQGTLNFASFFAPKRSASRRVTLATEGTQESKKQRFFFFAPNKLRKKFFSFASFFKKET